MDDTIAKPTVVEDVKSMEEEEEDGELFVLPFTRSIGQVTFELLTNAGLDGMIYKVCLTSFLYNNRYLFLKMYSNN